MPSAVPLAAPVFAVGQQAVFGVTFTDNTTGLPFDPSGTVTLSLLDPHDATTTYNSGSLGWVHVSTGVFQVTIDPFVDADVGAWFFKWAGTGLVSASHDDAPFTVTPSAF